MSAAHHYQQHWVAAKGRNLTDIFITHGHGDHWFAAGLRTPRGERRTDHPYLLALNQAVIGTADRVIPPGPCESPGLVMAGAMSSAGGRTYRRRWRSPRRRWRW